MRGGPFLSDRRAPFGEIPVLHGGKQTWPGCRILRLRCMPCYQQPCLSRIFLQTTPSFCLVRPCKKGVGRPLCEPCFRHLKDFTTGASHLWRCGWKMISAWKNAHQKCVCSCFSFNGYQNHYGQASQLFVLRSWCSPKPFLKHVCELKTRTRSLLSLVGKDSKAQAKPRSPQFN